MAGSYYISKKSHMSHHIILMCLKVKMSASSTKRKRSAHSITVGLRPAHSLLESFQSVDVRDFDTIDSLLISVK